MRKEILELARQMRKNPTIAEKVFWDVVKAKKFFNYKFYRQYPLYIQIDGIMKHFIADFYCAEAKLVIELDGGIHGPQKEYDQYRTDLINALSIRVIRFTNEEILGELSCALNRLEKAVLPSLG